MHEGTTGGAGRGRAEPVQVPTGIPGLDRLLNGGLRQGGLHVVLGGPGAGKSVLAHQTGATIIRAGGRVLYLTALVETHQTLIAQARTFDFFDPGFVPGSFYYASLYPMLARGGLLAAREEISRLVAHHNPSLVVIDGVHALKVGAEDQLDYQRFMHELEAQSAVTGVTTLLLAHPPEAGIATDPTFTIADAVFELRTRLTRLREVRMFSVGKLRGVKHIGGWHTFRITSGGLHLYPRIESLAAGMQPDRVAGGSEEEASGLLETGIDGLDEMVGGGLERGSTTLVVGTPGSGKTALALAFLGAGVQSGEPGLLLSYHEPPDALIRKAEGMGIALREAVATGRLHLDWRAPAELLVDDEAERLLALAETHGIKRVAIDAVEDVQRAVIPQSRTIPVLTSLVNLLRVRGITTIMLHDMQRVVGVNFDMPMPDLAAAMDNALHLRYVEQKGEMRRLIAVFKVRARGHDHTLREFHITSKGLSVGKVFSRSEMVLTGLGLQR